MMYDLDDYRYELPAELIAQRPHEQRDRSGLMVIDRALRGVDHQRFEDLVGMLRSGDVLVVNDTAVIPARLLGTKQTGGKIEVLLVDYAAAARVQKGDGSFVCECLVKAAKRPKVGMRLDFAHGV